MAFPEMIETTRLTLRRPRASDSGPMAAYAGDKRVAEMLEHLPHPYPPGAAEAFIERSLRPDAAEHVWIMDASKGDGAEFIGVIGVKIRMPEPQLGYWVGPPFWNTGFASEAAVGVVDAVMAAGHTRMTARVVARNTASATVLQHAGFVETGRGAFFSVAANAMLEHRLFTLDIAATATTA
ncbi:MAG: GNAT family N-acetyltransferase [Pseudomonadota bacterium]